MMKPLVVTELGIDALELPGFLILMAEIRDCDFAGIMTHVQETNRCSRASVGDDDVPRRNAVFFSREGRRDSRIGGAFYFLEPEEQQ